MDSAYQIDQPLDLRLKALNLSRHFHYDAPHKCAPPTVLPPLMKAAPPMLQPQLPPPRRLTARYIHQEPPYSIGHCCDPMQQAHQLTYIHGQLMMATPAAPVAVSCSPPHSSACSVASTSPTASCASAAMSSLSLSTPPTVISAAVPATSATVPAIAHTATTVPAAQGASSIATNHQHPHQHNHQHQLQSQYQSLSLPKAPETCHSNTASGTNSPITRQHSLVSRYHCKPCGIVFSQRETLRAHQEGYCTKRDRSHSISGQIRPQSAVSPFSMQQQTGTAPVDFAPQSVRH